MNFPTPLLVCDIGGTNVRIARLEHPDSPLSAPVFLQTKAHANLDAAVLATGDLAKGVRSLVACGAGPVIGRKLQLTNAPWLIDGAQIAERLGLAQGLLLNDFEALALSLPVIADADCQIIIAADAVASGPQLILGPGTGLGIGALIKAGGRYYPLASEACHNDFGPLGAEQEAFWPHLTREFGRVSTESVMSGRGLMDLHMARLQAKELPPDPMTPDAFSATAARNPASEAAASVRMFWQLIARFAGDMAITFMATGGVTLAGGVLPRLLPGLDKPAFAEAFRFKGPATPVARQIGVRLITAPDRVLKGMAAIATTPELYGIDYSTRAWHLMG